jgi:hypothetical protein
MEWGIVDWNSKQLLFAMACGVMNGEHRIAELDEELYKSLTQKVKLKFKMGRKDYVNENRHQCIIKRGLKVNKCSNKKKE